METGELLHMIASRAYYINEVAQDASYEHIGEESITDEAKLRDILRQLDNIADSINEYHDWGEEG